MHASMQLNFATCKKIPDKELYFCFLHFLRSKDSLVLQPDKLFFSSLAAFNFVDFMLYLILLDYLFCFLL